MRFEGQCGTLRRGGRDELPHEVRGQRLRLDVGVVDQVEEMPPDTVPAGRAKDRDLRRRNLPEDGQAGGIVHLGADQKENARGGQFRAQRHEDRLGVVHVAPQSRRRRVLEARRVSRHGQGQTPGLIGDDSAGECGIQHELAPQVSLVDARIGVEPDGRSLNDRVLEGGLAIGLRQLAQEAQHAEQQPRSAAFLRKCREVRRVGLHGGAHELRPELGEQLPRSRAAPNRRQREVTLTAATAPQRNEVVPLLIDHDLAVTRRRDTIPERRLNVRRGLDAAIQVRFHPRVDPVHGCVKDLDVDGKPDARPLVQKRQGFGKHEMLVTAAKIANVQPA